MFGNGVSKEVACSTFAHSGYNGLIANIMEAERASIKEARSLLGRQHAAQSWLLVTKGNAHAQIVGIFSIQQMKICVIDIVMNTLKLSGGADVCHAIAVAMWLVLPWYFASWWFVADVIGVMMRKWSLKKSSSGGKQYLDYLWEPWWLSCYI